MERDLITLITPKTIYNHILIRKCFSRKWNFEVGKLGVFYFWIYVIFMELFEINKSLQHGIQGIGHIILHSTNAFWQVRTHTWKNSSIFWMLKMSNFTKNEIFTVWLNESMDELFIRTHIYLLYWPQITTGWVLIIRKVLP